MEPRTREHLARARRNRDVARSLLGPDGQRLVSPAPLEWAVVAAFYAAVHYVNAYLWEQQRYEPPDHARRDRAVATAAPLRSAASAYLRLRIMAQHARYASRFRLTRARATELVTFDLDQVADAVERALTAPL